jgi:AbrB family looped-hinge helix DNA binding protein
MPVFIDKVGRLVLPKSVRQQLGITPDTPLELVRKGDGVLLRRVEARPAMLEVDGVWVHQGTADPSANWADVIDRLRDERTESTGRAEPDAGVP